MTLVYEKGAALVAQKLAEFGGAATLNIETKGAYDPITDSYSGSSTASEIVNILTPPASKGTIQGFDTRMQDGLLSGELKFVLMEPSQNEPKILDELVFNGRTWIIQGLTKVRPQPGGPVVIYRMAVK